MGLDALRPGGGLVGLADLVRQPPMQDLAGAVGVVQAAGGVDGLGEHRLDVVTATLLVHRQTHQAAVRLLLADPPVLLDTQRVDQELADPALGVLLQQLGADRPQHREVPGPLDLGANHAGGGQFAVLALQHAVEHGHHLHRLVVQADVLVLGGGHRVGVVAVAPARQRDVEEVLVRARVDQRVAGADGAALSCVDGPGVGQVDVVGDVLLRQVQQVAVGVTNGHGALLVHADDGGDVAVDGPAAVGADQLAVVLPQLDLVADSDADDLLVADQVDAVGLDQAGAHQVRAGPHRQRVGLVVRARDQQRVRSAQVVGEPSLVGALAHLLGGAAAQPAVRVVLQQHVALALAQGE